MDREDLKKAMQSAQEMQLDLVKLQAELSHTKITGHSKNQQVSVVMTGEGDFHEINIRPELCGMGVKAIEQGVLEAIKDATTAAASLTKERLAKVSADIGLPPQ